MDFTFQMRHSPLKGGAAVRRDKLSKTGLENWNSILAIVHLYILLGGGVEGLEDLMGPQGAAEARKGP
jgi:hypothetical protein